MTGPVRAAVLISQPIQHIAPGLRLLAQEPAVQPKVYYWRAAQAGVYDPGFDRHVRWDTDLHSDYRWWAPPPARSVARRGAAAWRQLRADRPEVMISFGWASPICRTGISFALATGTPLLYYGDTNGRAQPGQHPRLRKVVLRRLFRQAAGAVSVGAFNREFYLAHGIRPEQIHPGVLPTDVDSFLAAAANRAAGSAPDRPVVIGFAGKFSPIKAPEDLLAAVAGLPREWAWRLDLIGDGPLRPQLEAAVSRHGLADRVRFLGFRNTKQLPELMREVDVMVMPSHRESRGLVAIEAMAAGAAVVVSSATGVWGPGDAVQHEQSGLVYPAGNVPVLTGYLRRLLAEPEFRERLAVAGQARAQAFGPGTFAASVAAALVAATRGRSR